MTWKQEFWKKIFPHSCDPQSEYTHADVILSATGKNIAHLSNVLMSLMSLSPSEINFYISNAPVIVYSNLPKRAAQEVSDMIQATGATVELRYHNKV